MAPIKVNRFAPGWQQAENGQVFFAGVVTGCGRSCRAGAATVRKRMPQQGGSPDQMNGIHALSCRRAIALGRIVATAGGQHQMSASGRPSIAVLAVSNLGGSRPPTARRVLAHKGPQGPRAKS